MCRIAAYSTGGRRSPGVTLPSRRSFYALHVGIYPMQEYKHYIARANECQRRAQTAPTEDHRQSWLAMSESWRQTAELHRQFAEPELPLIPKSA